MQNDQFKFEFSLTILNHLGRNLYRSFVTVLGEAISNSWDADAQNVWVYIDKENSQFVIKDDGIGMNRDDFQNKFLKIGYSKRRDRAVKPPDGRPFIGRKGIGKLALLSCAERISIVSKQKGGNYVGSVISNPDLDEAIKDDYSVESLFLQNAEIKDFENLIAEHEHGTIIKFEAVHAGIYNTVKYLKKIVALYFRFSLLDESFKIHINDEEITLDELSKLIEDTQFLWIINGFEDPFVSRLLSKQVDVNYLKMTNRNVRGFIASVRKPSMLTIHGMEEKVSVDLFVNGRLRQKDIVAPVSLNRLAENYLYGQIHFNEMDSDPIIDRFTSNREGIVSNDGMFKELLDEFKQQLMAIFNQWDLLRDKKGQDGDPENKRISREERKSRELSNAITEDYKFLLQNWTQETVKELKESSEFNTRAYLHCFLAENILREYIRINQLQINDEARSNSARFKAGEVRSKNEASLSIEIRQRGDDLDYLDFKDLATNCETSNSRNTALADSGKKFRPIRNAVMHTSLMTEEACTMLEAMYLNIRGRIRELILDEDDSN